MRLEITTAGACRPRGNGGLYPARILTLDTGLERIGIDAGYGPLSGGSLQQRLYTWWFRAQPGPVRSDADRLLLTHAHLDHVGGVGLLPCWGPAWPAAGGGLKPLLSATFAETKPALYHELPPWTHERWGFRALAWDADLEVIELPGHAPGHVGVFLPLFNLFFVADAVWSLSWLTRREPPRWVYPLQHDKIAYRATLEALRRVAREHPDLRLRCAHDAAQPDHEYFTA